MLHTLIAVAQTAGVSETTVRKGMFELKAGVEPLSEGRGRRPSGGRMRDDVVDPHLVPALVKPDERGDRKPPLLWTTKPLRCLATELSQQGHRMTAQGICRTKPEYPES